MWPLPTTASATVVSLLDSFSHEDELLLVPAGQFLQMWQEPKSEAITEENNAKTENFCSSDCCGPWTLP